MINRSEQPQTEPARREFGSPEEMFAYHREQDRKAQRAIRRLTRGGASATGRLGTFDIREIGFQTREILTGKPEGRDR